MLFMRLVILVTLVSSINLNSLKLYNMISLNYDASLVLVPFRFCKSLLLLNSKMHLI